MNETLHTFLGDLDDSPVRTWSLIVTIYGDCVMPRGGELWLGSLTEILSALAVEPGSVRTAMSRLARDGFLVRQRVGRTSHYALSAGALAMSREAETRIYRASPPPAPREWEIAIITAGRDADKRAMTAAGFETVAPGVYARPQVPNAMPPPEGTIRLVARGDDAALAHAIYPLPEIRRRYDRFARTGRAVVEIARRAQGMDALALRIRLVHAFRRIVLRDPRLPHAALSDDWPAGDAYTVFCEAYRTVQAASDAWLAENAKNRHGALPPPDTANRFADM